MSVSTDCGCTMFQLKTNNQKSDHRNESKLKLVSPDIPAVQPSAASHEGQSYSLLGPDLVVHGTLTSRGKVEIAGTVHGDIRCVALEVSQGAQINGTIMAGDVTISGDVEGPVKAHRVTLKETAQLKGNIHHKSLSTEHGAMFEGRSCQSNDPTGAIYKIQN